MSNRPLAALLKALGRERAAVLDRLDKLEARVAGLERPDWMTLAEAADYIRSMTDALRHRAQRTTRPGAAKDGSRWLVLEVDDEVERLRRKHADIVEGRT